MIDKTALERMKNGAYLINVSRGGIIVEEDIMAFIKNGKLAGVALDVLGTEPPAKSHPLIGLADQNVIITPHMAWNTHEADEKRFCIRWSRSRLFLKGGVPPSVVNREALSNPRLEGWFQNGEA